VVRRKQDDFRSKGYSWEENPKDRLPRLKKCSLRPSALTFGSFRNDFSRPVTYSKDSHKIHARIDVDGSKFTINSLPDGM
jgi:hypothetical protein